MGASPAPPLVACVNSSQDLLDLIADALQTCGLRAVTMVSNLREGVRPVIAFLHQLRPDACVYAVSVPYRPSWAEFLAVRAAVPGCRWVVTTTNKGALEQFVGETEAFELLGLPYDLDHLRACVRRALAAPRPLG